MEMISKSRKIAVNKELLEKKKSEVNKLRICSHLSAESARHSPTTKTTSKFNNTGDSKGKINFCSEQSGNHSENQKQVNCESNTVNHSSDIIHENTQEDRSKKVYHKHVHCNKGKRFSVENLKINTISQQERDRDDNFCDSICTNFQNNRNVDTRIDEPISLSQRKNKKNELPVLSSTPLRISTSSLANHSNTMLHQMKEADISKAIMEIDIQEKDTRDDDSNNDESDNSVIANSILTKEITNNFIYYEQLENQKESKLVEFDHISKKCTNDLSFSESINELDNCLEKHKDSNDKSTAHNELPQYVEVQKTLSSSSNVRSHLTWPRPASMLNDYHDNNLVSICAQRVSTDVPTQRNSYFDMESEEAIPYAHNKADKKTNVHLPLPVLTNCESPLSFRQRAKTECSNPTLPENVNKTYFRTSSCRLPPIHNLSEMDEIHNDDYDDDDDDHDVDDGHNHKVPAKEANNVNSNVNVKESSNNINSITNDFKQVNTDNIKMADNGTMTENNKIHKNNIDCGTINDNNKQETFDGNATLTTKQEEEKKPEKCCDAIVKPNVNHWMQEQQQHVAKVNECIHKEETSSFAKFRPSVEVTSPIKVSLNSSSETKSFNTLSSQLLESEQTSPLLSSTVTNLDLLSLDAPIDMYISSGESDAKDLSSGISMNTAYFNVLAISTEKINGEVESMHKLLSLELPSPSLSHHCTKSVFSPFMLPPQHYFSPTHLSTSRSWNCDFVLHKAAQCNFASSLSSTNLDEQKQKQQNAEWKSPHQHETKNLTWSSESPVHHSALCNRLCEVPQVVLWDQPPSSSLCWSKEHDIPLTADSWNNETHLEPPD